MLTKKELAEALGVSQSTLNRWMRLGMPFTRFGFRKLLFDLEKCKQWVMSRDLRGVKNEKSV